MNILYSIIWAAIAFFAGAVKLSNLADYLIRTSSGATRKSRALLNRCMSLYVRCMRCLVSI